MNKKTTEEVIRGGLTVLVLALYGWTTMLMWGWFMVPLGVAKIGFCHALGLTLLLSFVVSSKKRNKDSLDEHTDRCAHLIAISIACIILGWFLSFGV